MLNHFLINEFEERSATFLYNPTKEEKEITWDKIHQTRESPHMEISPDSDHIKTHRVTRTKKEAYIGEKIKTPKPFFNVQSHDTFSYRHSISRYYGFQHLYYLGQANFYQLCGHWWMSRQILTILLVQNWFQLLGCKTQSFEERRQQRFPTGAKSYTGRSRYQPVHAIEKSANHCSGKQW